MIPSHREQSITQSTGCQPFCCWRPWVLTPHIVPCWTAHPACLLPPLLAFSIFVLLLVWGGWCLALLPLPPAAAGMVSGPSWKIHMGLSPKLSLPGAGMSPAGFTGMLHTSPVLQAFVSWEPVQRSVALCLGLLCLS